MTGDEKVESYILRGCKDHYFLLLLQNKDVIKQFGEGEKRENRY